MNANDFGTACFDAFSYLTEMFYNRETRPDNLEDCYFTIDKNKNFVGGIVEFKHVTMDNYEVVIRICTNENTITFTNGTDVYKINLPCNLHDAVYDYLYDEYGSLPYDE